jgi:hypothetical protein
MSKRGTVKVSGETQHAGRVLRAAAPIVLVESPKSAGPLSAGFRAVPHRRSTLAALCILAQTPTRRVMIFVG